jgi:hypothetical protein
MEAMGTEGTVIDDGGQEVVVEITETERRLAEGTIGQGAQVCFMRQHQLGVWMKMVGEIRLLTRRMVNGKAVHLAVVTLSSRPQQIVRRVA